MTVTYAVLGSGSNGNSYVFSDGTHALLVDAGFSLKELTARLDFVGIPISAIQALFLTHLHPDHARGAGVCSRKLGIPVYLHAKGAVYEKTALDKLGIPEDQLVLITEGQRIPCAHFSVTGIATSHDCAGSVGYLIEVINHRFAIFTDSGFVTPSMETYANQADILFLEANYDESMLKYGPYPYPLKQRVGGDHGHLSNSQAFELLHKCNSITCHRQVFLVHLSATNNNPALLRALANEYNMHHVVVCERGECYHDQLICQEEVS